MAFTSRVSTSLDELVRQPVGAHGPSRSTRGHRRRKHKHRHLNDSDDSGQELDLDDGDLSTITSTTSSSIVPGVGVDLAQLMLTTNRLLDLSIKKQQRANNIASFNLMASIIYVGTGIAILLAMWSDSNIVSHLAGRANDELDYAHANILVPTSNSLAQFVAAQIIESVRAVVQSAYNVTVDWQLVAEKLMNIKV